MLHFFPYPFQFDSYYIYIYHKSTFASSQLMGRSRFASSCEFPPRRFTTAHFCQRKPLELEAKAKRCLKAKRNVFDGDIFLPLFTGRFRETPMDFSNVFRSCQGWASHKKQDFSRRLQKQPPKTSMNSMNHWVDIKFQTNHNKIVYKYLVLKDHTFQKMHFPVRDLVSKWELKRIRCSNPQNHWQMIRVELSINTYGLAYMNTLDGPNLCMTSRVKIPTKSASHLVFPFVLGFLCV